MNVLNFELLLAI